jgi:hypothetical protein
MSDSRHHQWVPAETMVDGGRSDECQYAPRGHGRPARRHDDNPYIKLDGPTRRLFTDVEFGALATAIRDWTSELKRRDGDGYRAKLAACLARERLTSRELPLAASAVRAYNRHLYWQIRRERAAEVPSK